MMLIRTRYVKVSRRGAALVGFGVVFILLGYGYLTLDATTKPLVERSLRLALEVAPIETIGWAWIACGTLAVIGGLFHRIDWIGFTAAFVMPSLWTITYLAEWKVDHLPRAWVSAAVYGLIAFIIAIISGMVDPLDNGRRR